MAASRRRARPALRRVVATGAQQEHFPHVIWMRDGEVNALLVRPPP